jgi:hypothetical protein
MKLVHRFAYYGFGLLIGSIFVYFIWVKKKVSFNYFPNARVLKDIKNDVRFYSNEATENMLSSNIDSSQVSMILTHGNVDFKRSLPRAKPCKTYYIDGKPNNKEVILVIKKCDSISTIQQVLVK